MLAVQEYLQTHTLEELEADYGVHHTFHKRFTNLVSLKYDQLDSAAFKTHSIVRECRGIVLDSADKFNPVAIPFFRFLNHLEPGADKINWSTARVQEKVDGSLMIVYWYGGQWNVGTTGSPDASGEVNGYGFTFADLFWKTAKKQGVKEWLEFSASKYCTYMFELTSPYNQVVIYYPEPKLTLLGIRNINSSEYSIQFGWRESIAAVVNPVKHFDLHNLEEINAAFATFKGSEQEGFVVVDANFNRVKIKHEDYLKLHRLRSNSSPKNFLEVIRAGEHEEFLTYFPQLVTLFNDIKYKFDVLVEQTQAEYNNLAPIFNQKDFALAVQASGVKLSGALYAIRKGTYRDVRHFLSAVDKQGIFCYSTDNLVKILNLKEEKVVLE